MRITKNLFVLALFVLCVAGCTNNDKSKSNKHQKFEIAKEGAWCWFADPRALHHENKNGTINKTYIGYIDIHGNIKATQHDFINGETQEVLIRSWFQPDDHNNPTFLVLPDERVMIFYSRHTDEACFYYRVSKYPGDITQLGPELKIHTKRNTTYPSPFILCDDPNHFYLCWRGVSWHPTIGKFSLPDENDEVKTEWGPYQMVQSTASRPYAKYTSNGKDKIYMAYTTGHPDPTMPNYLYFNSIDINTKEIKDINGKVLSKVGKDIHHVAATQAYKEEFKDAVVDAAQLRDWLWQVVVDKNENPHIAMVQINKDKSSHDYYYAFWTGKEWKKTFLSNAGGHFHQSEHIEKCYSAGMAIDDQNPNELYCSVPVQGKYGEVYELVKYVLNKEGSLYMTDTLTQNSKLNNVRPYVIPNRGKTPLKLTWMLGNYYDWIVSKERPMGFNTSIYADYNVADKTCMLDSGLVYNFKTEKQIDKADFKDLKEFTIFLDVELDTTLYSGEFIKMNDVSYGIDGISKKTVFTIEDEKFVSENILANSDTWKSKPRSTNGLWYAPQKYTNLNITIIYSNGKLTSLINGGVDQVVELTDCKLQNLILGNGILSVNDIKVYSRKLNFCELNEINL